MFSNVHRDYNRQRANIGLIIERNSVKQTCSASFEVAFQSANNACTCINVGNKKCKIKIYYVCIIVK